MQSIIIILYSYLLFLYLELTLGTAYTNDYVETEDAFTCDEAVKYVIEKHPEMQAIMIIYHHFEITDKGLQAVLSSENMEKVEIHSGKITGTELNPGVNYSKNIHFLTLRCSGLLDPELVRILQLCGTHLKTLAIPDSSITGKGFSVLLGKLINLETLDVKGCKYITKEGMIEILQMCGTQLKVLDLTGTYISGEGLSVLKAKLSNLDTLNLGFCRFITKQGMLELLQMCGAKLTVLQIYGTIVTGEGLSALQGKLENLDMLDLKYCRRITTQGMIEILQMCGTKLKALDISGTKITGESLFGVSGKLINLEILTLGGCDSITQQGLLELLQLCGTQLKALNLAATKITGEGLSVLRGKLNKLETLYLRACRWITNQGMMELLQMCGPELKVLNLSSTNISGEGLSVLQGKLINLETLDLGYCECITDQGISEILETCGPGLRSLTLGNSQDGIPPSIQCIAEKAQLTRPKLTISETY